MPGIKPLKKLVSKARDLRDSHNERHRATGTAFVRVKRDDLAVRRH